MSNEHNISQSFVVMASVIVVLAGIKSAAEIIVPFLLSLFLAVIFAPAYGYLIRRRVPEGISLTLIIVLFLALVGLVGLMVGSSVNSFSANLPTYEARLNTQMQGMTAMLDAWGVEIPHDEFKAMFDPGVLMKYAASTFQSLGAVLANGFVILFTVIFILLETAQFRKKLSSFDADEATAQRLDEIVEKIKHYMGLKALISLATGAVVGIMLSLVGVDYALLWGVVAFMLNFIPNIGSIIAAVPAVLLAMVQFGGITAALVAGGYVVINTVVGSVVEPKVMGRGLGLSTLVIFLSLIFWGWLLGPVGMLLSVPLTIMVKIALDSIPGTRWIAVMLGSSTEQV